MRKNKIKDMSATRLTEIEAELVVVINKLKEAAMDVEKYTEAVQSLSLKLINAEIPTIPK